MSFGGRPGRRHSLPSVQVDPAPALVRRGIGGSTNTAPRTNTRSDHRASRCPIGSNVIRGLQRGGRRGTPARDNRARTTAAAVHRHLREGGADTAMLARPGTAGHTRPVFPPVSVLQQLPWSPLPSSRLEEPRRTNNSPDPDVGPASGPGIVEENAMITAQGHRSVAALVIRTRKSASRMSAIRFMNAGQRSLFSACHRALTGPGILQVAGHVSFFEIAGEAARRGLLNRHRPTSDSTTICPRALRRRSEITR